MNLRKFFYLFITFLLSFYGNTNAKDTDIIYWVMSRQHWQPVTQMFIKLYPQDPDAQILNRYLQLLVESTLATRGPQQSLVKAAEQAVEYCPCGVADLEYILTGKYPEGPCILIALTESVWLEHFKEIQERIEQKVAQSLHLKNSLNP